MIKNDLTRRHVSFGFGFIFLSLLLSGAVSPLQAQEKQISSGSPYGMYDQVEQSLTNTLPDFKQQLEAMIADFKKEKKPETLQAVKERISQLNAIIDPIRPDPNFDQVEDSFDRIKNSLLKAESALQKKNYAAARKALQQSDIYAKVLLESPVLHMTLAEIDLDQASLRIANKDYIASGLFLEKALDHIKALEVNDNPKLTSQINQIKNNIVVLHQQTILGKYKDELAGRSIWRQMRQAQVESMSHYYDMWSRTYHPWEP